MLLVLEDLHWADTSTLDLVVFLAHNVEDRPILLLGDLPSGRALVGRARATPRGRRPPIGLGARARAWTARGRRVDCFARGSRRRPAGRADGRNRGAGRRQPVLRGRAARRRQRGRRRAPPWPARPVAAARSRLDLGRRVCCASPQPQDATSLPALRRRPGFRSATCASRCAWPSSTASSSPIRRPAVSAFATPSWRRRSTRRSCPASVRSCTRSSPTSWREAELQRRPSSHRTGRRPVARQRGAHCICRRGARGRGRLRLGGGLRHLERALRSGTRYRMRPSSRGSTSPSSAPGPPSSQSTSAPPSARSSWPAGDRPRRRRRPASRRDPARSPRRIPLRRPGVTALRSPRSSARSSSCRQSRPRRNAPMRWGRWRAGWWWPGAMRSRCRSASRRSRWLGVSAHRRQWSGRSPCSAATSPTSAAARRVLRAFARPCSLPKRAAISSAWTERTSISPTR